MALSQNGYGPLIPTPHPVPGSRSLQVRTLLRFSLTLRLGTPGCDPTHPPELSVVFFYPRNGWDGEASGHLSEHPHPGCPTTPKIKTT